MTNQKKKSALLKQTTSAWEDIGEDEQPDLLKQTTSVWEDIGDNSQRQSEFELIRKT